MPPLVNPCTQASLLVIKEAVKEIKAALAKEVNLGFHWRFTPQAVSTLWDKKLLVSSVTQTLRTRVSLFGQKML